MACTGLGCAIAGCAALEWAALGRAALGWAVARAEAGVLAARSRAAVPLNTPLSASATTVITTAPAVTPVVRQRRTVTCRSSHSLRVVASTRPHDGSAADGLR